MHNFSACAWERRIGFFLLTSLVAAAAQAQTAPTDDGPAKQFVAAYVKAWNAGDTAALGRMWADDGELIDPQGRTIDRKALVASRLAKSEGARPVLSISLEKVRLLDPNVAMVDGESQLATPQGSVIQTTQFSGLLVRNDGTWRIRMIRHVSSRQSGQAPPAEPLKELAWMVGEWAGMGNGMRAHASASWDLGNRYIVTRFEYEPENGDPFDAEVRAGWDPEASSLKSWYFDSRGGVSTTIWQKNGDHWLGTVTGTRSDGQSFAGTMAVTQIDNDSYLRTLSNMKVGGQTMPDQELRMFRVPGQSAE